MEKFQIYHEDDEVIEFFVGGKSVGSANHDAHGWDGMELAEKLFMAVAVAVGAEVEYISEPEES